MTDYLIQNRDVPYKDVMGQIDLSSQSEVDLWTAAKMTTRRSLEKFGPFQSLLRAQEMTLRSGYNEYDDPTDISFSGESFSNPYDDETTNPYLTQKKWKDLGYDKYGLEWFDGVRRAQADWLLTVKKEELEMNRIIDRAPGGLVNSTVLMGAEFLGQLLDPINIAVSLIPFGAAAGAATKVPMFMAKKGVGKVAANTIDGLLGNALAEPLVYNQLKSEQAVMDGYDPWMNIAFGGILGAGLPVVLKGAGRIIKGIGDRLYTNQAADTILTTRALLDMVEGRDVDLLPVVREMDVKPLDGYTLGDLIEIKDLENMKFDDISVLNRMKHGIKDAVNEARGRLLRELEQAEGIKNKRAVANKIETLDNLMKAKTIDEFRNNFNLSKKVRITGVDEDALLSTEKWKSKKVFSKDAPGEKARMAPESEIKRDAQEGFSSQEDAEFNEALRRGQDPEAPGVENIITLKSEYDTMKKRGLFTKEKIDAIDKALADVEETTGNKMTMIDEVYKCLF